MIRVYWRPSVCTAGHAARRPPCLLVTISVCPGGHAVRRRQPVGRVAARLRVYWWPQRAGSGQQNAAGRGRRYAERQAARGRAELAVQRRGGSPAAERSHVSVSLLRWVRAVWSGGERDALCGGGLTGLLGDVRV